MNVAHRTLKVKKLFERYRPELAPAQSLLGRAGARCSRSRNVPGRHVGSHGGRDAVSPVWGTSLPARFGRGRRSLGGTGLREYASVWQAVALPLCSGVVAGFNGGQALALLCGVNGVEGDMRAGARTTIMAGGTPALLCGRLQFGGA